LELCFPLLVARLFQEAGLPERRLRLTRGYGAGSNLELCFPLLVARLFQEAGLPERRLRLALRRGVSDGKGSALDPRRGFTPFETPFAIGTVATFWLHPHVNFSLHVSTHHFSGI